MATKESPTSREAELEAKLAAMQKLIDDQAVAASKPAALVAASAEALVATANAAGFTATMVGTAVRIDF